MENIFPEIAKKLHKRDFTNLVARVQKGGKLTRAERAMLQSMSTGAIRRGEYVAVEEVLQTWTELVAQAIDEVLMTQIAKKVLTASIRAAGFSGPTVALMEARMAGH